MPPRGPEEVDSVRGGRGIWGRYAARGPFGLGYMPGIRDARHGCLHTSYRQRPRVPITPRSGPFLLRSLGLAGRHQVRGRLDLPTFPRLAWRGGAVRVDRQGRCLWCQVHRLHAWEPGTNRGPLRSGPLDCHGHVDAAGSLMLPIGELFDSPPREEDWDNNRVHQCLRRSGPATELVRVFTSVKTAQ